MYAARPARAAATVSGVESPQILAWAMAQHLGPRRPRRHRGRNAARREGTAENTKSTNGSGNRARRGARSFRVFSCFPWFQEFFGPHGGRRLGVSLAYRSLRNFIARLEAEGELVRVAEPVLNETETT